ncbi:MAG: hypothetical protein O3C21_11120, partial [Verrucomicrobia bacterium]|nr:hypothetical protein [Verrucomicrobiota bacterium]
MGTNSIVEYLRERLPETKILPLRIFRRTNEYRKPYGSERGDAEKRFASEPDGTILQEIISDGCDDRCL